VDQGAIRRRRYLPIVEVVMCVCGVGGGGGGVDEASMKRRGEGIHRIVNRVKRWNTIEKADVGNERLE
jgi:hypothetical protein